MPFAAYAAARSACTQDGTSAPSASRAGKWRTAVKISSAASPEVSPQAWLDAPDAKESSTSYSRAASAEPAACLTAREWDMEGSSRFRLMFAEGSTRCGVAQDPTIPEGAVAGLAVPPRRRATPNSQMLLAGKRN